MLQDLVQKGDFIQHNRLSVQYNQFDTVGKFRKFMELNDAYRRNKAELDKRNEQQNRELHKRKVFLMHHNQILKQKRSEMTEKSS